jgi:hypothetical protein
MQCCSSGHTIVEERARKRRAREATSRTTRNLNIYFGSALLKFWPCVFLWQRICPACPRAAFNGEKRERENRRSSYTPFYLASTLSLLTDSPSPSRTRCNGSLFILLNTYTRWSLTPTRLFASLLPLSNTPNACWTVYTTLPNPPKKRINSNRLRYRHCSDLLLQARQVQFAVPVSFPRHSTLSLAFPPNHNTPQWGSNLGNTMQSAAR